MPGSLVELLLADERAKPEAAYLRVIALTRISTSYTVPLKDREQQTINARIHGTSWSCDFMKAFDTIVRRFTLIRNRARKG